MLDLARRREDVDSRAWAAQLPSCSGDDVTLRVQAHPIDAAVLAKIVQHLARAKRVVVLDRISAQLTLFGLLTRFALRIMSCSQD